MTDRSDGCYICPTCGRHVQFSVAEFHPCPLDMCLTHLEPEPCQTCRAYIAAGL